ncbi:MAG: Anti-sigma-E factor ChrR [Candidatus Celerinatantimonas neptuna]|nr:MAG: Anti-sigma-E factor ChrR [Candidatus Celerinatantimonas neptuna]
MIEHHPHLEILRQFVDRSLPVSISVIVSAHVELCSQCQRTVEYLTKFAALEAFELLEDNISNVDDIIMSESSENGLLEEIQSNLMNSISNESVAQHADRTKDTSEIDVAGQRIVLPKVLMSIALKEWKSFGKISRARLQLNDGKRRTSLLRIDKGGCIPSHSHCGFEITLPLHGRFDDEMGHYGVGDFIWLNTDHTHAPQTSEGCLCLTVSDDALRFRQGVSQLINPLGKLIY